MAVVPEVKPGEQTTEYVGTLLATVLHVIIGLVTLLHPGFKVPVAVQGVILSEVTAAIPLVWAWYGRGRVQVKTAQSNAVAQVAVAEAANPVAVPAAVSAATP